jgi:hypothetical protein
MRNGAEFFPRRWLNQSPLFFSAAVYSTLALAGEWRAITDLIAVWSWLARDAKIFRIDTNNDCGKSWRLRRIGNVIKSMGGVRQDAGKPNRSVVW